MAADVNVLTRILHNIHAQAYYQPGSEDTFKPIQASAKAAALALAACAIVRIAESFISPRFPFRWEASMIMKGAPCIYAAAIIAYASHNYTLYTKGELLKPPPKTGTKI